MKEYTTLDKIKDVLISFMVYGTCVLLIATPLLLSWMIFDHLLQETAKDIVEIINITNE